MLLNLILAAQIQQCRFAAAIPPDDANGFAFFDFKGNVVKRPKFSVILFWIFANQSLKPWIDSLL
jgi:hypothetical protein